MHAGNLEYVPVVRTSTAAGMWKFGNRAWTKVSLAIRANISAVSTNRSDCLSRNAIMCADLSTLEALLAHLTRANNLTNN